MTELIRPEARDALRRWSEVALTLVITATGVWFAWTGLGIVRWAGVILACFGVALMGAAVQRLRFSARGDGAGVVTLVEGEIRHFGPHGGGFVAIASVASVGLDPTNAHWVIHADDGSSLVIPRNAHGADALFDAFMSLEGWDMPATLRILAQPPSGYARTIWSRNRRHLLT